MAITPQPTQRRHGPTIVVTALSDLTAPVYFFWFFDGIYRGANTTGGKSFTLRENELADIDILDSTDPNYDYIANAPATPAARYELRWIRSGDTVHYVIEEKVGAGAYAEIARVSQDDRTWEYTWLTRRLNDLTTYTWKITPYDTNGNAGPVTEPTTYIVRKPDPPNWVDSYSSGTQKVTISAAA